MDDLNRADTLTELYDTTARAVRDLTGFDRVMVYRYDARLQRRGRRRGQARRPQLRSSACTTRPPTSRPRRARCTRRTGCGSSPMSTTRRCRSCRPSTRTAARPLDLTYATLRSVSPIHLEYLQNMGVHASMSISLLRAAGCGASSPATTTPVPHLPPFGTRAAAEFLGSTLSLRLVDRFEDDELRERLAAQAVLAKLDRGHAGRQRVARDALLGAPDLLDLVAGRRRRRRDRAASTRYAGSVPPPDVVSAVAGWAREAGEDVASTECLARDLPDLARRPPAGRRRARAQPARRAVRVWFRARGVALGRLGRRSAQQGDRDQRRR